MVGNGNESQVGMTLAVNVELRHRVIALMNSAIGHRHIPSALACVSVVAHSMSVAEGSDIGNPDSACIGVTNLTVGELDKPRKAGAC
jgi:hypothetical protein